MQFKTLTFSGMCKDLSQIQLIINHSASPQGKSNRRRFLCHQGKEILIAISTCDIYGKDKREGEKDKKVKNRKVNPIKIKFQ